jgi:hypothetical protein
MIEYFDVQIYGLDVVHILFSFLEFEAVLGIEALPPHLEPACSSRVKCSEDISLFLFFNEVSWATIQKHASPRSQQERCHGPTTQALSDWCGVRRSSNKTIVINITRFIVFGYHLAQRAAADF